MDNNHIYFKSWTCDGVIFLDIKDYQDVKKILNLPSGSFDKLMLNDFLNKENKKKVNEIMTNYS
jgi:hypothetical protein